VEKSGALFSPGRFEVIEEYDQHVHAITFAIKLPSIIRLSEIRPREKTTTA